MTATILCFLRKIPAFIFFFSVQCFFSQVIQRDLGLEKWTFSQEDKNEVLPAKIPGTVHTDLLLNSKIPDPFFGDNEKKLQWIGEENWIYQTTFNLSTQELSHKHLDLIFNGLDTFADIFLNGEKILTADNMFRTWKIPVKRFLKKGENRLTIKFFSASKKGKELAKLLPYRLPENERVFVRKAQSHFGWDWGPRFVTAGIWKPVTLEMWSGAKIETVKFTQEIQPQKASLSFITEIESDEAGPYTLLINGREFPVVLKKGKNKLHSPIFVENPKLWYPSGYGEPFLYPFKIELKNDKLLDEKSLNIGLRTIELVQEKDDTGKSFYFKVNGIPVYAKGANVIPPHAFIPSAEKDIYKKWIGEALFANMNMLRIWGGGIYGADELYEEADKKGILIWQDFMFACAMYPGDENFLNSVKQEVTDQANRLQNHASLAIWCGNNENDEGWHNWGWQKQLNYTRQDSAKVWNDYVKLFREIIPETLDSVSAQKPVYWQSSPSNGWGRNIAYREGDVHYWGVWWGMEPFEKYREKTGRFVSEYGFQAMPTLKSFEEFANISILKTETTDKALANEAIKNHQKHPTGFQTITTYMERDYKVPEQFEDYVYVSQLLQARGMKIAVEAHRQKKPNNMGTLYWQLNDVWPAASWSSLDFYGGRKAAHYQFKRSFEPVFISVQETADSYKILVNNDSGASFGNGLSVVLCDFRGKNLYAVKTANFTKSHSNKTVIEIPKRDLEKFDLKTSVLKMTLESEKRTYQTLHFFGKPKDMLLEKPMLKVNYKDSRTVELLSDVLAKDVYLISESAGNFDDNFFDLLPGETKTVTAENPIKSLKIKSLYDVQ